MIIYVFDGSFQGLLTAIFEFYERQPDKVQLVRDVIFMPSLVEESLEIITDDVKAQRVFKGFVKKSGNDWGTRFYKAYLSELPETFQHLFDLARYVFDNADGAARNFGHPDVIYITKMEKSVNRERHRMKAFIRFQETADGIYYAPIDPDYNVLPLISDFFKGRYQDQKWIIYDIKRNYGLYYDLNSVTEIKLDLNPTMKTTDIYLKEGESSGKEGLYGLLWKDYFKSTSIVARKNMKLHIQHVPKRYWKYLTEKQQG